MYAVILAGGSGTRFWPLSREEYPKQLLTLFGNQSLIQATLSRIADVILPIKTYIVTNPQQAEQIQFQLAPAQNGPRFIYEPIARSTTAAIGLAATYLYQQSKEAIMVALSADHFIQHPAAFKAALEQGAALAKSGVLVTLGAKPTRPETAYGYIVPGKPVAEYPFAWAVERFIEKPDYALAFDYFKNSNMLWNTGIFIWQAATILQEIKRFLPALSEGLEKIGSALGAAHEKEILARIYPQLPSISVDYAILEKSDRLAVIPTEMGWEDMGSWNALSEVLPKDPNRNILHGNVACVESQDTIVYANKRVVAIVGLKDMMVVDTDDATLVCPKEKSQDVKKVVELLKKQNGEIHRLHRTVIRAWGSYTVLEEGPGYKVKRLHVNPGAKLSLQTHKQRSEHWVVISGTARVTCDERVYTIEANQSTFVPMGVRHRLENQTHEPLELIEVQAGSYLGEDDIVRYDE